VHPRSDFGGGPRGIPHITASPARTGSPLRTSTTTGEAAVFDIYNHMLHKGCQAFFFACG
jgi:hypothetical protein